MARSKDLTSNILFEDTYKTDSDKPRLLLDKLALNSKWGFMVKYTPLLFHSRKVALRGDYNIDEWISSSVDVFQLAEGCGGRFDISGLNNISETKGPVVFIGNHMSTLETMVLPGIILPKKEVTFVVKNSLVTHPIFGPTMRATHPIIVTRTNPRTDFKTVMSEGKENLDKGKSVFIFPQSKRMVDFRPEDFSTLGVKLAKIADVPIIPVALKTNFWGNGKYIKEMGPINRNETIHIAFDKPIKVSGNGKEEHQVIINYILLKLAEWDE